MTGKKILKTRNLFLSLMLIVTAAFSTSCGESSTQLEIPGVDGPQLTLEEDNLLISMTFENLQLDGGLRYAIPEYDNSYLEISPDLSSAGTLMSINVSLDDVFNDDLLLLDPQKLPGDRNLPGVASGALPAVAFSIPNWDNMTFYLGKKFFGVFVPVEGLDIGTNNIVTARFYSGKVRAGNISMVGADENGENAGFVLLLDLSSSVKRRLKKIAKKY
ncbi:MAG: hypothetical protein CME63_14290 [Halobacteriovoraceae bacterium]|nr:hypothetical protein [Halobacteriovoraceae bacterium]MBC98909.1 hypothetical protein [Halobacteriovoraceae bacterium]|tara:strand:+ start:3793 stop:4443 length:651 start_codon:yes stop_codon:yes gene_type:complete